MSRSFRLDKTSSSAMAERPRDANANALLRFSTFLKLRFRPPIGEFRDNVSALSSVRLKVPVSENRKLSLAPCLWQYYRQNGLR